jgi:hypothetical protein
MKCDFHRTPYKIFNYLESEHLTASRQPRKYSQDAFKTEFQKKPKMTSEVLGFEELGGLSDPRPWVLKQKKLAVGFLRDPTRGPRRFDSLRRRL